MTESTNGAQETYGREDSAKRGGNMFRQDPSEPSTFQQRNGREGALIERASAGYLRHVTKSKELRKGRKLSGGGETARGGSTGGSQKRL